MHTELIYSTDTQFEVDTVVQYLEENNIETFVETQEDVNHPYLVNVNKTDYHQARELIHEYTRDHKHTADMAPLHTRKTLRILRISCACAAVFFGVPAYGAFLNNETSMGYLLAGISALFICLAMASLKWKANDMHQEYKAEMPSNKAL